MVDKLRSWFSENHTLVVFLAAQVVTLGAAAAWMIAYSVKLETRVSILETRGAEFTVARIGELAQRITIIEQRQARNEQQIERIVDALTKGIPK